MNFIWMRTFRFMHLTWLWNNLFLTGEGGRFRPLALSSWPLGQWIKRAPKMILPNIMSPTEKQIQIDCQNNGNMCPKPKLLPNDWSGKQAYFLDNLPSHTNMDVTWIYWGPKKNIVFIKWRKKYSILINLDLRLFQ